MAGRGCLVSLLVTTHSCSTSAYRLAIDALARTWLCWRHKAVVVIELGRSGPQCCSDFACARPNSRVQIRTKKAAKLYTTGQTRAFTTF
jgi:hypothetical protein